VVQTNSNPRPPRDPKGYPPWLPTPDRLIEAAIRIVIELLR
jgi:hypothetical protein